MSRRDVTVYAVSRGGLKRKRAAEETMKKIQDVLRLHVNSAQSMYGTFKRMGDVDKCRYEQGLIDGLERAIEVADNMDEQRRKR